MTGCHSTNTVRRIVKSLLFCSIMLNAAPWSICIDASPVSPHSAEGENVVKPCQIGDSGYVVSIPEFKMKSIIGDKTPDKKERQPEATNPAAEGPRRKTPRKFERPPIRSASLDHEE